MKELITYNNLEKVLKKTPEPMQSYLLGIMTADMNTTNRVISFENRVYFDRKTGCTLYRTG